MSVLNIVNWVVAALCRREFKVKIEVGIRLSEIEEETRRVNRDFLKKRV